MNSSSPLCNLTVVELGTSVAAPVAGHILADLGAKVVKIENPQGGDDARGWGPPFDQGVAPIFRVLNRNKRSVALDFKDEAQNQALRSFILDCADIVIQNLRPGLVERYRLDAKTLREANPRLIYCNLSAFGMVGPRRFQPGYDPLMQACGGIMSVTGHPDDDPVRVGPSIVDQGSGMWSVIGILAALQARNVSGQGCVVDTSLYETAVSWVAGHVAAMNVVGRPPKKMGTENAGIAPYRAYKARDGWLVIAAGNDNLFERLCDALGTNWIKDSRFSSNAQRVLNREELNELLSEKVSRFTVAELRTELDASSVPNAPVLTLDQVVADTQFQALKILQPVEDGGGELIGLPLSFDGDRPPLRTSSPDLGEGNDLISNHSATR